MNALSPRNGFNIKNEIQTPISCFHKKKTRKNKKKILLKVVSLIERERERESFTRSILV